MHCFLRMTACFVLVINALSCDGFASAPKVENHSSGSTIRYSVVLLRGKVAPASKSILVKNRDALPWHGDVNPVVHDGKFKALVELSPGKNLIQLSTDDSTDQMAENPSNVGPYSDDSSAVWVIRGVVVGILLLGALNALSFFFRSQGWGSLLGTMQPYDEARAR